MKIFIKLLISLPLNEEPGRCLEESGRYLEESGKHPEEAAKHLKAHLRQNISVIPCHSNLAIQTLPFKPCHSNLAG
ncbi:MAG: hypothetical protein AB3K77_16135 [Methanosarcinaceae archaeon]